jgi:hypothetical protein
MALMEAQSVVGCGPAAGEIRLGHFEHAYHVQIHKIMSPVRMCFAFVSGPAFVYVVEGKRRRVWAVRAVSIANLVEQT